MLTTGLLTLNIHDSLTFEGAELCLSPDLFSIQHRTVAWNSHVQNSASAVSDEHARGIGASSAASVNSGNPSQNSINTPLNVGDMVEIRVWDPLPKDAATTAEAHTYSPASSCILKKAVGRQTPPPTPLAPVIPTSAGSSNSLMNDRHNTKPHSHPSLSSNLCIPTLRPKVEMYDSNEVESGQHEETGDGHKNVIKKDYVEPVTKYDHSEKISEDGHQTSSLGLQALPTSAGTSVASVSVARGNGAASVVSMPPLQPQSSLSLPPVFPRQRTGTADGNPLLSPQINPKTSKPALIHRRVASTAGVVPVQSPMQQQRHQLPFTTRHVRDTSDMTVDTLQLDITGGMIQPKESHELTTNNDEGDINNESSLFSITSTNRLRLSFVLKATEKTFTSFKGNSRTQISMLRQVADLYNLSNYDLVTVHKIERQDEEEVINAASADFVVVTIKDQFISRGDMLLFQTKLVGSWIYEGQRLTESTRGIKAHAREIRHGNYSAKSGIVTDKTMITFRSRAARIVWLVQLSSEMWDYASPYEHQYEPESICEIYFDRWIRFLYKLFKKWKELEVTHSLTVIFFSRTYLSSGQRSSVNCRDVYGRECEDHYKPVIENQTCVDWESLILSIKKEFMKYPMEVGWNLKDRRPSSASQGNLLEAINVTLNLMQYHYLDRDLHRTGQSIVIVSAGGGVFEVEKKLASITYQRMMDNGIGSDMLSLGLPPLHIAPFFLYNDDFCTVETEGIDASSRHFEVPHYMHLSFVTYDRPEEKRVYLSGLEDKKTPVQTRSWLGDFDVGPNGFLKPQRSYRQDAAEDGKSAKPHSPLSSFSLVGNKAATPGKARLVQERGQARQLISGRNFRDILEACRPRELGASLSSALESILSLKQFAIETEVARRIGSKLPGRKRFKGKDVRLREWGTVDFGDFVLLQAFSKSSRCPSPSTSLFKLSGYQHSAMKLGASPKSEEISIGSSFASSPRSSTYGTSFDRVFWDCNDSPKRPVHTLQMQKSPSFQFDEGYIEDAVDVADESQANSDNVSNSSTGGETYDNGSQITKNVKYSEQLQRFMDSYDSKACTWPNNESAIEPGGNTVLSGAVGLPVHVPELGSTPRAGTASRPLGNDMMPSGGLRAALSQYGTISTDEAEPSINLMKRRSSGGNLLLSAHSRTTSFNNERRRAVSPIFNSRAQYQHERNHGSSNLFSSTLSNIQLLDPTDHGKSEEAKSHTMQLSSANRADGKDQQGGISATFFAPHSVTRRGTDPSSVSYHDPHWQRLLPISQSPPSSSGLAGTLPSAIGVHRPSFLAYPRSPPKTGISRDRSVPTKSVAQSPPKCSVINRERSGHSRTSRSGSPHGSFKGSIASGRKKAFNPFRQSDEDEVLAKRSHNRRRWSHVFPAGEVEFKRHAGPIWNSLTSPAILPLSVDYFPSPQELRDETKFQFNFYQVTLGGIENNHYATHSDLLMEMVRQRVTQDFQIVTASAIAESESRAYEFQREGRNGRGGKPTHSQPRLFPSTDQSVVGTTKHYLSMGHRIQVMEYNPHSDTIEIIAYNRKSAKNDKDNVYNYKFLLYSKVTEEYTESMQRFKKYNEPYKWNRVDNLMCGEEDRTMDVGMRFRRLMFGLIPETFDNVQAEDDYVAKFQKFLSYLEKLREKDDSASFLSVPIITSMNRNSRGIDAVQDTKARRDMTDSMIRFSVQLLRGKKDPFEWIEIAIDSTFDTSTSYRIMFNWLVASSAKVETQLQLLQRRCTQYGLKLISFPQTTVSWNLFLHALAAPSFLCIRDKENVEIVDDTLQKLDFVYDGVTVTSPQFLECIDGDDFNFARYRSGMMKSIPSPQYVHRSGALFIRKLTDRSGKVILVGIENYRHASNENMFREITRRVVRQLKEIFASTQDVHGKKGTEVSKKKTITD